jgi:hypothetical protein
MNLAFVGSPTTSQVAIRVFRTDLNREADVAYDLICVGPR